MIYIYGIIVALQIVLGQVLWKFGVERSAHAINKDLFLSSKVFSFVLSPYILLGVLTYGAATLLYVFLLSKYEYSSLQAVVVSSSLALTFIAASLLFGEKISFINLVGFLLLVSGVFLITKF